MPIFGNNFIRRRLPSLQREKDKLEDELQSLVELSSKVVEKEPKTWREEFNKHKKDIEMKIRNLSAEIDLMGTITVHEVRRLTRQQISQYSRYVPLIFVLPIIASIIYFLIDRIFFHFTF